jgi:hypothetical protein
LRERFAGDGQGRLLAGVAAQVLEEYRVERAALEVADRTEPERDSLMQKLEDSLAFLRERSTLQRRIADEEGALRAALHVFLELAHVMAWIAAADLATGGDVAPDSSGQAWMRLIGPHYVALREALSRVPAASTPVDSEWLTQEAITLIPLLVAWLKFVGVLTGVDSAGGATMGWDRTDF